MFVGKVRYVTLRFKSTYFAWEHILLKIRKIAFVKSMVSTFAFETISIIDNRGKSAYRIKCLCDE